MSDFWTDITDFNTGMIEEDDSDKQSRSADELAVQQGSEFAVQEGIEISVQEGIEISVQEGIELSVQQGVELTVQQGDELSSYGKDGDCTVKDSNDSKTSAAATKMGKVSFEINDSDDDNMVEKGSTSKGTKPKKYKLTPEMFNRMKTLLLQKSHYCSKDDIYIGDLINAVEGELMELPKKRNRKGSMKRQEKIKPLTKNKIRSINKQRLDSCLNMEILSSFIYSEFENIDETLLKLRQASSDFNAEFNHPLTPIGEPYASNCGMEKLFLQIKENLPIFQDCFKEVKHCSRQFVKADMTLTDSLQNTVQTYLSDRLKGKHIPRVHYSEVLKTFNKSNRQHCHFDVDVNAVDKTSDAELENDNH